MKYFKIISLACLISCYGCDGSDASSDPAGAIGKMIYNQVFGAPENKATIEMLDSALKMQTGKTLEETYIICARNGVSKLSNKEQQELAKYMQMTFERKQEDLSEEEIEWAKGEGKKYDFIGMALMSNIDNNCIK